MPAPIYPLLSDVLNAARVQSNDAIVSIAGQTLVNTFDFTPVIVNRAWQMFQQFLVSLGYVRFVKTNFILAGLPAVSDIDTATQVTLSWDGYDNGSGSVDATFALPADLIKPLKLSERPSDAAPNEDIFVDMDGPEQGVQRIPNIPKQSWNQIWTWDNDQIKMPGSLVDMDQRIDYAAYIADFTTGTFPGAQTCNIARCTDAFAGFIAFAFCDPRGSADAAPLLQAAQDAARIIAGVKVPQGII